MKIPQETIEEVKRRADIIDVIGDYVNLKSSGKNYKGLCPFHSEKTPSFSVSPDGVFYCFGCKESGNSISFIQKYLNLSFVESIKFLADKYGVRIVEERTSQEVTKESLIQKLYELASGYYSRSLFRIGKDAYEYFQERKVSDAMMMQFGLGYSPNGFDNLLKELRQAGFQEDIMVEAGLIRNKNGKYYDFFRHRAMFPIKDFLGRVIAFGGRQLVEDKAQGKYVNSPDSPIYDKKQTLFGLSEAKTEIRKTKTVIIVEGYLDVISLFQAGIKNVVAPCGTALSKEQLLTLKKYTSAEIVYFMFDGDSAGIGAALRGIGSALELGLDLRIVLLPANQDPDSIVNEIDGKSEIDDLMDNYYSFVAFIHQKFTTSGKFKTPAEKSAALTNIIQHILLIPDQAQHKFYLDEVQELFSIESIDLRAVYNKVQQEETNNKAKRNFNHQGENSIDSALTADLSEFDKKIYEKYNKFSDANSEYSISEIPQVPRHIYVISELLPAEQTLIKYSLQSEKYFDTLINEYSVKPDFFISDLGKIIFEMMSEYSSIVRFLQDYAISNSNIPAGVEAVINELKLSEFGASSEWDRFGGIEQDTDIVGLIEIPLAELNLIHIDNEIQDIQRNIASGDSRILSRFKELNEQRMAIHKKYKMV